VKTLLKHTTDIKIEKITGNKRYFTEDTVIKEFPFTIHINGKPLVTLLCSPMHLDYLALGYLESEGFIQGKGDVNKIDFDQETGSIHLEITHDEEMFLNKSRLHPIFTTGCGKGTTYFPAREILKSHPITSPLSLFPSKILSLVKELENRGELFRATGGAHISALADGEKIIFVFEDIGRHNALDKLFGACMMHGVGYEDKIIVTSGRISSEMLIKCARRKIPLLISRSAATGLAVDLAEKTGITLIGFVRENRMNIYTHGWRIK
jgi:FdhD protein